jgi:hypothetical protein
MNVYISTVSCFNIVLFLRNQLIKNPGMRTLTFEYFLMMIFVRYVLLGPDWQKAKNSVIRTCSANKDYPLNNVHPKTNTVCNCIFYIRLPSWLKVINNF